VAYFSLAVRVQAAAEWRDSYSRSRPSLHVCGYLILATHLGPGCFHSARIVNSVQLDTAAHAKISCYHNQAAERLPTPGQSHRIVLERPRNFA